MARGEFRPGEGDKSMGRSKWGAERALFRPWLEMAILFLPLVLACRDTSQLSPSQGVDETAGTRRVASLFRSREYWQEFVERADFAVDRRKGTLQYSLEQFEGDCEIHLTKRPEDWHFTLEFVRGGTVTGPFYCLGDAMFRGQDSRLFYVHGRYWSAGAYNLCHGTGLWFAYERVLWEGSHSFGSRTPANLWLQSGVVVMAWADIDGDYVRVLDQVTGECLAQHKMRDAGEPKINILPEGNEPDIREFGRWNDALPTSEDLSRCAMRGQASVTSSLLAAVFGTTQEQSEAPFSRGYVDPKPRPKPIDWEAIRKNDPKTYWKKQLSEWKDDGLFQRWHLVDSMLEREVPCDIKLVLAPRPQTFDRLDEFPRLRERLNDLCEPAEGILTFGDSDDGLSLPCHLFTDFECRDGILYYPIYKPRRSGCVVGAYELSSGKELWRSQLEASGAAKGMAMRNTVGIWVSEDVVVVRGHEGRTAYAEVFHRESGERLGHRRFGQGRCEE